MLNMHELVRSRHTGSFCSPGRSWAKRPQKQQEATEERNVHRKNENYPYILNNDSIIKKFFAKFLGLSRNNFMTSIYECLYYIPRVTKGERQSRGP
jgi:hypothetical protein